LVDTSVLDFMEDIGLTADDFSKDLGFHYDDSVGYKLDPMGVEIVSDPKGNDKKYSIQLKGKKANFKKAAEFLKTHVDADKVTLKGNTVIFESNMSDVKKQLGKVKGLSKDAYNQLITLPMPVLTTVVNQLSGLVASYDMNESDKAYAASLRQIAKDRTIKNLTKKDKDTLLKIADLMKNANESVNENLVAGGQFKSGDMANSDLSTSIELLQHHKKMAERQRPKLSDPVLVKSLEDVISQIDKTIKGAEKEEKVASKSIAKASAFIKKTFDLINKKKYLIQSAEVEGDTIEEAMGGFPQVGSKFALKKKHVKMIQDIIKSKGNAAANHIQMKMGYSKSAAQDLIDLAQGRAIYGKKLGMTGSGVVESLSEQLGLQEAFNIEKGARIKMDFGAGQELYGKVIKQIKVNGKPGVTVQWKSGTKGNFRMDQFANALMDKKADYVIKDDGVRFDNK